MLLSGQCLYSGDMSKSSRCRNNARMMRASCIANCAPMQFLGPCAKGLKAIGCFDAATIPCSNREGSNLSGFGHKAGLWCKPTLSITIVVPFLMRYLSIFTSASAWRASVGTAGRTRRVSLRMHERRGICARSSKVGTPSLPKTLQTCSLAFSFHSGFVASR